MQFHMSAYIMNTGIAFEQLAIGLKTPPPNLQAYLMFHKSPIPISLFIIFDLDSGASPLPIYGKL